MIATVVIWGIVVLSSLRFLATKEPLDRARLGALWIGGYTLWFLGQSRWTPTQIAAGLVCGDAILSAVLISAIVAYRIGLSLKRTS